MSVIVAMVLAGIGTYAMRAVFILAMAKRRFPPLALRALEHVAPAVLGSLVVSMLMSSASALSFGLAEAAGLLTAVIVAWRTRNHVYTLVAAMGVLWMLSA
jgi:branched-subunit amino acid transport protein